MAGFDLIEIPFGPNDFEQSLEDEFLIKKISDEIEAATDIKQVKAGAIKLLQLAVMRQGMIRGLIRRLGSLESSVIRKHYDE